LAAPPDSEPRRASAGNALPGRRGRFLRALVRALALAAVLVAAFDLGLRFLAPPLLRNALLTGITDFTGRPATLERVEIAPWSLVLRLRGLSLGEQRDGSVGGAARTHARLALLEADVSWRSLRRLAPVVERLRIEAPEIFVARSAGGVYDGTELLAWLGAAKPDAPADGGGNAAPAKFSIANIVLAGGNLIVDDRRLDLRHALTDIGLRVPFVSSLPVDQGIEVEPGFEAVLDGAPIRAEGRMLPFATEPTGELDFTIEAFDLTRWLAYLPDPVPVRLVSGALASTLKLHFSAPAEQAATLRLTGRAALGGIELLQPDGRALAKLPALEALDIAFDADGPRLSIGSIVATRPEIAIERRAGEAGFLEPVARALAPGAAARSTPDAGPGSASESGLAPAPDSDSAGAFTWSIGKLAIEAGRLNFDDQAFSPRPLRLAVEELAIEVLGLAEPATGPAKVSLSALADGGEQLAAQAELVVSPLSLRGKAAISELPVSRWAWLAGDRLALEPSEGSLALEAGFAYADGGRWSVADGQLALRGLRLLEKGREAVRIGAFEVSGVSVDPNARRIELGRVALDGGRVALRRLANGEFDALDWWKPAPPAAGKPDPGGRNADGPAWQGVVRKLSVSGVEAALSYAAGRERAAPLAVSAIDIEAGPLPFDGDAAVPVALSAQVDRRGRISAKGTVRPATGALSLALQLRTLPVPAVQPWLPDNFNARLTSGALSADGRLELAFARGEPTGNWQGSVSVADLNARLKREAVVALPARRLRAGADPAELLGWRSLRLEATRVTFAPRFIDLGDIAIDGLRSRLVIQSDGRFNLQALLDDGDAKADGEGGGGSGADGKAVSGTAPDAASGNAPRADDGPPMEGPTVAMPTGDPAPKTDLPPVRIGRVKVSDGNIDFSDYFIQPNYSANLTGLAGEVGEMGGGEPADLRLDGRIDNTGTVRIEGRIDPIGEPLFLDLKATARDIDLPALSPYSGKYVGYGIEKGKLSVDVAYRLENGQLTANNRVVLDQLTFGEPVDSPDALQLPVLFAVSLLKDRNGVIDVEMPISGSLDDPQFSIAGLVVRIIGNLIVRAITSPFSLIAGLVGADAGELSVIEFAPAEAALDDTARERLAALAKGLTERPALQLEIGGRWLDTDRSALQQAQLDARLKRIRRALTGADFQQPIGEAERAGLLAQAWLMGRVPPPPEKDRPAPEAMQRELVESVALPPELLTELATRRAQAAKDWLAGEGKIDPGRLFVVAPKAGEDGAGLALTLK
jgi:uncharacterized protein involved in outer membrane biogenesis